jgi:hypothetical protein
MTLPSMTSAHHKPSRFFRRAFFLVLFFLCRCAIKPDETDGCA